MNAGILFFFLFCIVQVLMYLVVRRRMLPPLPVAALGVVVSVVSITLMGLAQGNLIYQAIFAGIVVGGLLSAATLGIAIYFLRSEERAAAAAAQHAPYMPPRDEPTTPQ
jgi:Na+/H+-translocating membrane pyrophosphatase